MKPALDRFVEQSKDRVDRDLIPLWRQLASFEEFADALPESERIAVLLHCYDLYRSSYPLGESHSTETSIYSILISTLLPQIKPDEGQTLEILKRSFHTCGHGSDVAPPVDFVDRVYKDRPYNDELFRAAGIYLKTLMGTKSLVAAGVKQRLKKILWFDPLRTEKRCWTSVIQRDLTDFPQDHAIAWQMLLRHEPTNNYSKPTEKWTKPAKHLLTSVGEEKFLESVTRWFTAKEGAVATVSPVGSTKLRTLLWYASLSGDHRLVPVLLRFAQLNFKDRAPVNKVIGAIATFIGSFPIGTFPDELRSLRRHWPGDGPALKALYDLYFPPHSPQRIAEEEAALLRWRTDWEAKLANLSK